VLYAASKVNAQWNGGNITAGLTPFLDDSPEKVVMWRILVLLFLDWMVTVQMQQRVTVLLHKLLAFLTAEAGKPVGPCPIAYKGAMICI